MHYIQVEYDLKFYGGDYDKVGNFALIPESLVNELGLEAAFTKHTGHEACHIIHYTLDELYDASGELVEEDTTK